MDLPFSLFIALKYLRPKRTFISVVTVISILGVLLGVAVLVIVLSVMSGFDQMWRDKILGFNAHLTVAGWKVIEDDREIIDIIEQAPGVVGAAPYVQGLVFIQRDDRIFTPFVRGIQPDEERRISRIPEHMTAGEFAIEDDEVLVGADLARRLNAWTGDKLLLYSPRNFTSASDELYLPTELTIRGIFDLGMWDFDMGYILTTLDTARNLFGLESGVHGIQVMTTDPYQAPETARAVRRSLGGGYNIQTWMEMNRQLFSALRVEKNMMFFLLIFITVVAAFGITNTLITLTVQKTREIGLLKALGYSSGHIMRIFVWQGLISGVIGTIAGIGTGLLILHYRNDLMHAMTTRFGWELFPKELYHLTEIPAKTSGMDIAIIAVSVMVICTVAGVIPAWRAARLDPAKSLRYE
ncbi:MAG: ABC transporter permease [Kiritimatiellae bacterium]|nr:ABC transporter permease [Kiritimatiellia bacterium]MDD4735690.1 ABC transporter permease [Kiritimatiellia bacterium]